MLQRQHQRPRKRRLILEPIDNLVVDRCAGHLLSMQLADLRRDLVEVICLTQYEASSACQTGFEAEVAISKRQLVVESTGSPTYEVTVDAPDTRSAMPAMHSTGVNLSSCP